MLKVLKVVALFLFVILGSGVAWLLYMKGELEASSKAFIEDSIPRIFGSWSMDELRRRAAPQLLQEISEGDGRSLFETYRPLGALRDYGGSGEIAYLWSGPVTGVIAEYKCSAIFVKGEADIMIQLHRRENGEWKILSLQLDAALPAQALVVQPQSPPGTGASSARATAAAG